MCLTDTKVPRSYMVQGCRKQIDIGGAEKSGGGLGQCPDEGPGGEAPGSLAFLIISKP